MILTNFSFFINLAYNLGSYKVKKLFIVMLLITATS